LRKDAGERYQTAGELLADLKGLSQGLSFTAELERSGMSAEVRPAPGAQGRSLLAAQGREGRAAAAGRRRAGSAAALAALAFAALGLGYWLASRTPSAAHIESIAVMPFVNQSGDADAEYLADGMTESLINSLSQMPRLSVKARSTVFRYKGREVEPRAIAAELSVQAVLSGRVMQRGERLTLSLELADARTGDHLWGRQYSRELTDLVSLQSEVARDVSRKLQARLSGADERRVTKNYTADTQAYQHYLKGRYHWNRRTSESLRKAIQEFRAATDKDPSYALAYVGLADCYVLLAEYAGTPSSETLPQAHAFAARALEIDDSLAEAHASAGFINAQLWQWAEAGVEFERAVGLNPNYPTAHHWRCLYLRNMGRFDDAFAEIKRAQELDPLSSIINGNVAVSHLLRGDAASAAEQSKKMVELDPNDASGHLWLGLSYLRQGRNAEAVAEMQKTVELSGREGWALSYLGYAEAISGRRREAAALVAELEGRYAKREALGLDLAQVYAGLGEKDAAFDWLEKDFQARSGTLAYFRWYSQFDSLRGDPRYAGLLRRMNLPQ
jgi:TolB-like protein/Flp pilus assembly protein TadD